MNIRYWRREFRSRMRLNFLRERERNRERERDKNTHEVSRVGSKLIFALSFRSKEFRQIKHGNRFFGFRSSLKSFT